MKVRIGLEIHVPLNTEQKLFCSCPTNYYEVDEPNINVCPVCTGMPGSKPYPINKKALDSAVIISKLIECKTVREQIYVKRKHYNYPDLPSGYQRTSEPLGVDGRLGDVGIW
ncbi:MAG: Asp-tRNA(Asn)/Glu-tRNA(Gln) amidotransferase GatCAB subunit B, partial [Candidatus Altiarchaeales archaeon ex4484_96]